MKNQNDLDKYLDNLITKSEKEIVKIYAKTLKNVRAEMALMYEKYSTDGTLTLAEMSKYSRLDKLMDSIIEELVTVYKLSYKLTQTTMQEQMLETYFRTAYLMEYEMQAKLGFGSLAPATIEASLANPVAGLTLSEVLEKNRAAVVFKVKQEITQGLVNGESYGKMAKRLRETFEGDANKALRVVRTEAGRAQSIGRENSIVQAQKYSDNIRKVWSSTLDKRTRDRHRTLDGKFADKDGYFHFKGMKAKGARLWGNSSMDINCRCSVMAVVNGRLPSVRRARLEDGKTAVIPFQTFDDWKESRIGNYVKK